MRICMILKRNLKQFYKDSRVLKEALSLIDDGNEVTVLLSDFGGLKKERILSYKFIKLIVIKVGTENEYVYKTMKAAIKEKADVYHCHDYETLKIGFLLKMFSGKSLVYDSHEFWSESKLNATKSVFFKRWIRFLERIMAKTADKVITVNDSIASLLERNYKIKPPLVLRNVPILIIGEQHYNFLREELNIDQNKKIVLYQGAVFAGRGIENLIRAWQYVNEDIVLVIMGFGQLYDVLSVLYSAQERIYFKPAVSLDILISYTKSADIGICPTQNVCLNNYLSSPNKIFEYIAAGIPVLASDFPEFNKLTIEENLGLSFNSDDPKDIALKINYVLSSTNETEFQKIKKNCIRKGQTEYNWGVEKNKLIDLYKKLSSGQCD